MIVWDLGGVVARFDSGARLAALTQASGLPPAQIRQAIWHSGLDAAAERGLLDDQQVWPRVLDALDHTVDGAEVRRCWSLAFVPDPAVLAIVDRLGPPAALFTDNGPIVEACLRHELGPLADRFDPIFFSWRLRATKQDPVAFHRAARMLGVEPATLTLIDDHPTNVLTARKAGWQAIQFETADALERALRPPKR